MSQKKTIKITLLWTGVVLLLFPILVILGIFMRMVQANFFPGFENYFYIFMTLHGVAMIGIWNIGGMAGLSYLLSKHVRPSVRVSKFVFVMTIAGILLLLASTMIGKFAAGWYFLYPLPFYSHYKGGWPSWAASLFFSALTFFVMGWLIWGVDLLRSIAKEYSISEALGWNYIFGKPAKELQPIILIATVTEIAAIAGLLSGMAVILFYAMQAVTGDSFDPLLLKNLTMFFGHIVANQTMYLGVAIVYELLPNYTGRPWKTNKLLVIAWNCVLLLVLLAYFHHLYMDFVQPEWFQYIGQMVSYFSAVPAAVMSIFGALYNVYGSRMKWNLASSFLFLGVMGWAVGGIGAVMDSTIALNFHFHNTLWVPAHFHTYYLMGVCLMILGFFYQFTEDLSGLGEKSLTRWIVSSFLLGGYGFILMFFIGGTFSIPRRYAIYPDVVAQGTWLAQISLFFILIFVSGMLLYLWEVFKRWVKAYVLCGDSGSSPPFSSQQ